MSATASFSLPATSMTAAPTWWREERGKKAKSRMLRKKLGSSCFAFHHGEQADDVVCLYTDGDAWTLLTGFDEMIKHMVAANEPLIRQNPALRGALLDAFRESFAYSERNMD